MVDLEYRIIFPNCQLKCNMAMKLNIDENIVERCGSEEACGAWY